MKKPLITLMLLATGAISLQATAQTKAEFDELRQEVMRLRQEINAQKAITSAAPAAASAGMVDRLDQVEIKQKDAVVLGDIGGSFRLPGSETSVKLYGFAELNMVREGKADNSGNDYSTFVPYAPINGTNARKGQTYLHARTSRFGVETSTPTAYGPLGIKVEGDFNNEPRTGNSAVYGGTGNIYTQAATNSYGFRVRQAYGTVGGFTAGQTWSTFMDVDNSPENVDFNGPIGSTFVRQPLVKYAYGTQESGTFTVAAENSVSYILDSTGAAMTSGFSKLPDLVGRWDKSYDWGSVSARGVTLEHRLQDATSGLSASKRGYGLGATAFIKTREAKDFLSVALTYGKGIGRYFNYVEGALYDSASNAILLEKAVGLVAGYQYKHSDTFRANFVLGYQKSIANEYSAFATSSGLDSGLGSMGQFAINKSAYQAHIGFIYNPIKGVDLGAEYILGQRMTLAGEKGSLSRINLSAKYNF